MPDNFNKPSYNRKQQLYVESQSKKKSEPKKSKTKSTEIKHTEIKHNKDIYIPTQNSTKKNKNRKNKGFSFKKFAGIAVVLLFLTSTLTYASYKYFSNDLESNTDPNLSTVPAASESKKPENVNVLLIGLDKNSYHTDTMIVANLNTGDGSIELMSIPRDTYTILPTEVVEEIYATQENPIMPTDGVMKLTELITYTQDYDLGLKLLTEYVETLLGIDINNYFAVDLESFSYLIDEMGGVYFDVPQRMYYNDNAQNLHIDLQPGYQLLNGDEAEQLIRFRKGDESVGSYGYATGDLGRIEVQQAFLKEVINQVLAKENIMGNMVGLAKTYYNYVTTDMSILDIPKYADYALSADKNNITTYSLPVEYDYINNKSYALVQEEELTVLRDKMFFDIEPEIVVEVSTSTEAMPTTKPKEEYSITILNGSGVSGFAGRTKSMLEESGFTVLEIGDYTDQHQEKTRFFVNNTENGTVLESYFDEAEVVYSPQQVEDIIVVLGTNETLKGKE